MTTDNYAEIAESVAKTIASVSKPLTEDQKIVLSGALAVWLSEFISDGYLAGRAAAGKDAERYAFVLECDYRATKHYLPDLDETAHKAKLRAKHDAAMAKEQQS
jgi:hypothetical protein